MRILFTGASSFTGHWLVERLARAGHEVVATMRGGDASAYEGIRGTRVANVSKCAQISYGCSFGDRAFLELVESSDWDLLCHHAADVTDYKSPEFDVARALENNTHALRTVLQLLRQRGCSRVVLTGSIFENDEGSGSEGLPAFSPYGLSKSLTFQCFRHHARDARMRLGKFVIPNPFGPLEDPRFTAYLMRAWSRGEIPAIQTPRYVRDNIHVSLLAEAYLQFVERLSAEPGLERLNPSGYAESQGAFAERVAREMEPRLGIPCKLELCDQQQWNEPRVRINTDFVDSQALDWSESAAWDAFADFYRQRLSSE